MRNMSHIFLCRVYAFVHKNIHISISYKYYYYFFNIYVYTLCPYILKSVVSCHFVLYRGLQTLSLSMLHKCYTFFCFIWIYSSNLQFQIISNARTLLCVIFKLIHNSHSLLYKLNQAVVLETKSNRLSIFKVTQFICDFSHYKLPQSQYFSLSLSKDFRGLTFIIYFASEVIPKDHELCPPVQVS